MAFIGFCIIFGWIVYKFFTRWLWWCIGLMILFGIINWFTKYGWLILMIVSLLIAIACFSLLFAHYRELHQNK